MTRRPRHKITKLTPHQREIRTQARWKVIQIVNNYLMQVHQNNPYLPAMLSIRHIQRAVHIGRQAMILPGKLLIEAGFNAPAAKPGVPTVLKKLIGKK